MRNIRNDDRGTTAVIFALCLLPIMAVAAGAIDLSLYRSAKLSMQASIDGATLSAARMDFDSNSDRLNYVEDYFETEMDGAFDLSDVEITIAQEGEIWYYSASATMQTMMLPLIGLETLDVNVDTGVTEAVTNRRTKDLEFVFLLDMTNSMKFVEGNFEEAKASVGETFETLEMTASAEFSVHMSMIPVADRIHIGDSRESWLAETPPSNWNGCVEPRYSSNVSAFSLVRDPSDRADPSDYAVPGGSENDGLDPDQFAESYFLTKHLPDSLDRKFDYSEKNVRGGLANRGGGYPKCGSEIYGPTQSSDLIGDELDAMSTTGTGRFDLALAWGWRMLSPDWRAYWGDSNYPADFGDTDKAIAIITDSKTTAFTWEASGDDGDRDGFTWNTVSDEGFEHLLATCQSIKDDGIIIYVVLVNSYDRAIDPWTQCATSNDTFFDVESTDEFDEAMVDLAGARQVLRLVK